MNLHLLKKIAVCLFPLFGTGPLCSCGQKAYTDADVQDFAGLLQDPNVQLLDVRTQSEYDEGHLSAAQNIDVKQDDFLTRSKAALDKSRPVAVYCRSGRRSANAASRLAAEGYTVTNLKGGIVAWTGAKMPTTTREVDIFTTKSGKHIELHALMHASIRIVYEGKEIEVDPVAQLGSRTTDYSAMPKADYILVTHEHADHYDKGAIAGLTEEGRTLLVTNHRCAEMLGYGTAMANGERQRLADFDIEAVPAYNTTADRTQFHPRGRDNGYVLTIDGLRIYIAGDTEDIPEMAGIKDVDIAFMPCNQPYTMTPEQLVSAAKALRPRTLFPYHYGKTDLQRAVQTLRSEGIDVRIRHYE